MAKTKKLNLSKIQQIKRIGGNKNPNTSFLQFSQEYDKQKQETLRQLLSDPEKLQKYILLEHKLSQMQQMQELNEIGRLSQQEQFEYFVMKDGQSGILTLKQEEMEITPAQEQQPKIKKYMLGKKVVKAIELHSDNWSEIVDLVEKAKKGQDDQNAPQLYRDGDHGDENYLRLPDPKNPGQFKTYRFDQGDMLVVAGNKKLFVFNKNQFEEKFTSIDQKKQKTI